MSHFHLKKTVAVFEEGGKLCLLQSHERPELGYILAESKDGERFKYLTQPLTLSYKRNKMAFGESSGFRSSDQGKTAFITWVRRGSGLVVAEAKKSHSWSIRGEFSEIKQPAVLVSIPSTGKSEKFLVFSTSGQTTLTVATLTLGRTSFRTIGPVARLVKGSEYAPLSVLSAEKTDEGILVLYSALNGWGFPMIGALVVDTLRPDEVLWRSGAPLWEAPLSVPPTPPSIIGIARFGKKRHLYLEGLDGRIEVVTLPEIRTRIFPKLTGKPVVKRKREAFVSPELVRFAGNPLLEPVTTNYWESFAAFNPAALHLDGKIHLLYRAQGYDGISVLGYASSHDGIHVCERSKRPVFVSSRDFDTRGELADLHPFPYVSGGGYGGCEDPRLILIENTVYLIYVAFDGARPPGVALSSIAKDDFLAKRWTWKPPKLISRPGTIQKNWVLFPEKIHGKFAILHGISPKVQIEYVESLDDLGDGKYIESLESHGGRGYIQPERRKHWDNIVRGAGAPPIRTEHGWLVFYHAMDFRDPGKYKVGAMILDLDHPETILHRAKRPILEPEAPYENNGHKRGVIYVCGAVVKDDILFVYYGASDRAAAVAAAPLADFLADLTSDRQPTLSRVSENQNVA